MSQEIDDICFKSVSDKRWVQKLFESTPKGKMSNRYNELLNYINDLQATFNNVYYSKQSLTLNVVSFISETSGYFDTNEFTIDEIRESTLDEMSEYLKKTPFGNFSSNTKFTASKNFKKSSFVMVYPAIIIQISLRNLCYGIGGIVYVKSSGTKYGYGKFEQLLKDEGLYEVNKSGYNIMNLLDDVYSSLESQEDLIKKQEKFSDSNRLETFKLKDIESGDNLKLNPREDGIINLMEKKKTGEIIPFIYTSQIISDDLPRSIEGTTKSLLKNLQIMKAKTSTTSVYTINTKDIDLVEEGRKPLTQEEKDEKDAKAIEEKRKKIEKKLSTLYSEGEFQSVIGDVASNIIDVYIESIKLANNGVFNKDYKNSTAISSSLQIYQPEILSPYVIAFMEGEWDSLMGEDGKQVFRETFNIKGNKVPAENCLIGYYSGMSEPLCDSYMWIRASGKDEWRKIGISTKGGVNGKGASASITSIKDFIFNYNGKETSHLKYKDSQWELTTLGKILKNRYKLEFEVFSILTSMPYKQLAKNPKPLIDVLHIKNPKSMKMIFEYINSNLNMASFIIDCLKSASFEFIQLNATPYVSEKGLHYGWKAQYPAVFIGDVQIEIPANGAGYTKFHIL